MTACNQCGGRMVPDVTAIVPALGCEVCGRLVPLTDAPPARVDRIAEKRALRAARRARLRAEFG